jgi:hypothetical protein
MKGEFYKVIKGLSNKEKTSIGLFYKEVGRLWRLSDSVKN